MVDLWSSQSQMRLCEKKAKSRPIVFWKIIEPKEEGKRPFPLIRYSNVYNIEDTTLVGLGENWKDNYSIEEIDAVINNYLTKNSIGLVKRDPCYIQSKNQIGMPNIRDFDSTGDYYHAYFHEMIHSTGKLLDRDMSFKNQSYSKEELVAEIGACMLLSHFGIETDIKQSASYIDWWRSVISKDNNLIISAAQKAQKAIDYILDRQ